MSGAIRNDKRAGLIIADVSRFQHDRGHVRSRNPSPLELFHSTYQPPYRIGQEPIDEQSILSNDQQDYKNHPLHHLDTSMPPYPLNVGRLEQQPQTPLKDDKYYGHRHILQAYAGGNDLPPVQDLRDYMVNQNLLVEKSRHASHGQPKKPSHNPLVDRVMNKPLVRLGPKPVSGNNDMFEEERPYVVSSSTLCEVLQLLLSIVVTTLLSVLGSADVRTSSSIYRYFIAAGVMSLVAALLFVSKTVRYEKKNAAVFCSLACIFTGVALVLAIATFATDSNCATAQICSMRKALATITILSFLLWMGSTIVYVTTLYISHMDGLHSPPGYSPSYSESAPSTPRKDNLLPLYFKPRKQEVGY